MIPLKDNISSYTRPIITYTILGVNIVVFLYELSLGTHRNDFIFKFGATPYNILHPANMSSYATIFTSMFIHANPIHILGNMLFLWVFADNVEDRIGHIKFLFFYLIWGIAGALLHSLSTPNSKVPMVGASGAISGVLGAYLLLFPNAKILTIIPFGFFMRITFLPAMIFLGIWFLYQFIFGISTIAIRGGVAYFAHIGGFIAGLLFTIPFKMKKRRLDKEVK